MHSLGKPTKRRSGNRTAFPVRRIRLRRDHSETTVDKRGLPKNATRPTMDPARLISATSTQLSLNHWSILELSNFSGTIPADAQFAFTPKICLGKHSTENSRATVARIGHGPHWRAIFTGKRILMGSQPMAGQGRRLNGPRANPRAFFVLGGESSGSKLL